MTDTKSRIAAGLERAFVRDGFAKPNIETLRDAAGVSLRTLYRYAPSREEMVLMALEHRHQRYIARAFAGLPEDPVQALGTLFDRIAEWMAEEAAHGCLFHAAVAATPNDARLQAVLARHKTEVAHRVAKAARLPGRTAELALIVEGLMQGWPLLRGDAVVAARNLCAALIAYDAGRGPA